jgi:hypothetical protein
MKHLKHLKHILPTCVFYAQCQLVVWMNHGARRAPWRMKLAGAPLGEDMLDGLGEHLREGARAPALRPKPAHSGRGIGQAWRSGDGGTAGDDGGGTLECPDEVGG